MANPKYIDESLLYNVNDEEGNKKVSKKAYSFRCDETLLDGMNQYASIEGISMPQILSNLMADFLEKITLTNTYLPEYESRYINIPSNVNDKVYEYEIRYVPNNLDVWSSSYGYISMAERDRTKMKRPDDIIHEGIDFVVIPETLHLSKNPEHIAMATIPYHIKCDNIPYCLYSMYITVSRNGSVDYQVISWIDAMNKLKAAGRYDIISHANQIKMALEKLHDEYLNGVNICDDYDMIQYTIYGKLRRITSDFNTGAILPASESIDKIEYAPIVEHLPDNYDIINRLIKENKKYKGIFKEMQEIADRLDELESRNEVWDDLKNKDEISSSDEELPDDPQHEMEDDAAGNE